MKKLTSIFCILVFFLTPVYSLSDQKHSLVQAEISLLPDKIYYTTLIDYIRKAEKSIDVAMFLFKTTRSRKNKPRLLIKELIKARKRGVVVRVILEKSDYADSVNKENERVAQTLQANGILVLFDSIKTTTHVKMVVIDRKYSFIGSHNFTHAAFYYNHEMSLLIESPKVASEFIDYIKTLSN